MEYYVRSSPEDGHPGRVEDAVRQKQEEVDPDQVDAIQYRDKDKRVRFLNLTISGTPEECKVHLGKAKKSLINNL